jgi:hypothetical protein
MTRIAVLVHLHLRISTAAIAITTVAQYAVRIYGIRITQYGNTAHLISMVHTCPTVYAMSHARPMASDPTDVTLIHAT